MLRQHAIVRDVAASIASGEEGRVRIGFAGASSQRALPLLTRAVREAHPGIELILQSQTYVYTAFDRLMSGDLDLAFVRLPIAHRELSYRVVEVERLLCALPSSHPLAHNAAIDLRDLVNDDFVSLPDDQGSMLQATMISRCAAAGFRPKIAQVAPDSSTVLALVAAGAGVTVTLSSVSPAQTIGIVYRPIAGGEPDHLLAALGWRTDNKSPALRRVLDVSSQVLPTPDLDALNIKT